MQCLLQRCHVSACRRLLSCLLTSCSSGLKSAYLLNGQALACITLQLDTMHSMVCVYIVDRCAIWHPCNIQQAMSSVKNGLPAFLMIAIASLLTAFLSWHISSYLLLCRGSLHRRCLHPPASTFVVISCTGSLTFDLYSSVATLQLHTSQITCNWALIQSQSQSQPMSYHLL